MSSSSSSSLSFSSINFATYHPSDLRPLGDAFLSGSKNISRITGLGPSFRTLSDEFIQSFISSYCTPNDCGRLASVSKAWYAFTTTEDLWRNFTLGNYGTKWKYQNSWRETYARSTVILNDSRISLTEKYRPEEGHSSSPSEEGNNSSVIIQSLKNTVSTSSSSSSSFSSFATVTNAALGLPLFRPLSVKGFYSDILFRPWYVSQTGISWKWLQNDNIPRLHITKDNTHLDTFIKLYDDPGIPVILTNIANHWPAHEKWSWDKLRSKYGTSLFHAAGFDFPFQDYLDYMHVQDDQPLIIFDKYFAEKSDLSKDYIVPPHFSNDLFTLLDKHKDNDQQHQQQDSFSSSSLSSSFIHPQQQTQNRPDYRWLIIGPKRSGSVFHQDPNGTSAFNACIRGTKKWFLFPPHIIPPGVYPSEDGSTVATTMSVMEWFIDFYDAARKIREKYSPLSSSSLSKKRQRYEHTDNEDDEEILMENLSSLHRSPYHHQQRMRTIPSTGGGTSVNTNISINNNHQQHIVTELRRNNVSYRKPSRSSNNNNSSSLASSSSSSSLSTCSATSKDPRRVPMEGLVKEGEIIFVPRGWWHIVLNVEDTVAITQNFCTPSGLPDVLQFCQKKPESISGFSSEKEKDSFYSRLYQVLQKEVPDTLQEAEKKLEVQRNPCPPKESSDPTSFSTSNVVLNPDSAANYRSKQPQQPSSFSFGFTVDEEE